MRLYEYLVDDINNVAEKDTDRYKSYIYTECRNNLYTIHMFISSFDILSIKNDVKDYKEYDVMRYAYGKPSIKLWTAIQRAANKFKYIDIHINTIDKRNTGKDLRVRVKGFNEDPERYMEWFTNNGSTVYNLDRRDNISWEAFIKEYEYYI